jgi:hypothetical protein
MFFANTEKPWFSLEIREASSKVDRNGPLCKGSPVRIGDG